MSELHLYAQEQWHDDAFILGTREALEKLRQAIGEALCDQESVAKEEFFCADGEGYQVNIRLLPSEWIGKSMLPYTGLGIQPKLHRFPPSLLCADQ